MIIKSLLLTAAIIQSFPDNKPIILPTNEYKLTDINQEDREENSLEQWGWILYEPNNNIFILWDLESSIVDDGGGCVVFENEIILPMYRMPSNLTNAVLDGKNVFPVYLER